MIEFIIGAFLLVLLAGLYASHVSIKAELQAGVAEVKALIADVKAKVDPKP